MSFFLVIGLSSQINFEKSYFFSILKESQDSFMQLIKIVFCMLSSKLNFYSHMAWQN